MTDRLEDIIKRELTARGYTEIDAGLVLWQFPEGRRAPQGGDKAKLMIAVADCIIAEREAPLSNPGESKLGPFARDSATSRKAALDAYPRQGSQRSRIIGSLAMEGGATREELAIRLALSENTIRPRVRELIDGGWIEESDHTRPTTRGSDATILELTHKARDERAIRLRQQGQA